MQLRKLELGDAPLMLEWMHDDSVVHHLGTNFATKTLEDCQRFIQASQESETDLHLALTDDNHEYMGTVSLKHIDKTNGWAEFAVTIRACAMGKGYSRWGMSQILELGLKELGLNAIYWCVSPKNQRAVRFYDKNGYRRISQVPASLQAGYEGMELYWYIYDGELA